MSKTNLPSEHERAAARQHLEKLLQYRGPSLRREQLEPSDVTILDYRNSEENKERISTLLSSQGIPFHIGQARKGWSQSKLRLLVSVPRDLVDSAQALLGGAAKAGVIEAVEGLQGIPGVPEKR